MNKIAYLFMRVGVLAACLSLAACCKPSTSVVKLVDQAVENENFLANQHMIAYDNQKRIVSALPEFYRSTQKALVEACQFSVNSNVSMLRAEIDTAEQKLRVRFEKKAWSSCVIRFLSFMRSRKLP